MKTYRYSLIRYIADTLRMEPVNVGIILQDEDRLNFQLNTRHSQKENVDTAVFNQWKEFLTEEIRGEAMPLFQPKKSSLRFFSHLDGLCDGAIRISEPLIYQCEETSFDLVLSHLYQRLVAPLPTAAVADINRPSGRFRQMMRKYNFLRRGMKRHSHLELPDKRRWMPYQQVLNGELLAIDRVEVSTRIDQTADEIQSLAKPRSLLKDFLSCRIEDRPTRYVLLADELRTPFTDQSKREFEMMRDDLEQSVDEVRQFGGEVIRSAEAAREFAESLNRKLPVFAK